MNGQKSTDILKIGQVLNLIQVYDEQILFSNEDEQAVALIDYILYLENGSEVVGTTDDKGLSGRVTTSVAVKFSIDFDSKNTYKELENYNV